MKKIILLLFPCLLQSCGISLSEYIGTEYYNAPRPVHDHNHITILEFDEKAKDIEASYSNNEGIHEVSVYYDQRINEAFFFSGGLFGSSDLNQKKINIPSEAISDLNKYQRGFGGQFAVGNTVNLDRVILQTQLGGSLMQEAIDLKGYTPVKLPGDEYVRLVPNNATYKNTVPAVFNSCLIGFRSKRLIFGFGLKYQLMFNTRSMLTGYHVQSDKYSTIVGEETVNTVIGYIEGRTINTLNLFTFGRYQVFDHVNIKLSANIQSVIKKDFKQIRSDKAENPAGITAGINYNFSKYFYRPGKYKAVKM